MSSIAVNDALIQLYGVFSTVPMPAEIDVCSHCHDDNNIAILLTKQLHELTADELASYASSAMLTAGDKDDFRYFLPRILEIRVIDPAWWPDIEVISSALRKAQWQLWFPPEREAVLALFEAVIGTLIEGGADAAWEFDSWICAFARIGQPVIPHLDRLLDPERAHLLRELHEHNLQPLKKGKLSNSFWSADMQREVVAWFQRPDVVAAIENAYGQYYASGA